MLRSVKPNNTGGSKKYSIVSSEGALYVILPYDYQAHPLFEHTPVLKNNFDAMMTLVTMITMMTKITKIT